MPELIVIVIDILIRKVSIGDEAFYTIPLTICLVFVIIDADVDTKDNKKSLIDINYPDINHFDVVLDNRYLSMDIFYPKSTK